MPLAVVVLVVRLVMMVLLAGLAGLGLPVILAVAMAVAAVDTRAELAVQTLDQAARAVCRGAQAEAAAVRVLEQGLKVVTAVRELEERCEYGPGSSKQRRTQRPGCAEA
jgi:hydroxyethylthiazole kinase-like sugar kinase family protein